MRRLAHGVAEHCLRKTLGRSTARRVRLSHRDWHFDPRVGIRRVSRAHAERTLSRVSRRNTQTNPNEALKPERSPRDAGVVVAHGPVSARVTAFWNVLNDAITNITLSTTPQLITKQRANADQIRRRRQVETTGVPRAR